MGSAPPEKSQVYGLGCSIYAAATNLIFYKDYFEKTPLWFPADFDPCLGDLLSSMMSANHEDRPSLQEIQIQLETQFAQDDFRLTVLDNKLIFNHPGQSTRNYFLDYTLLKDISSGGFGTACYAEHTLTGEGVVSKFGMNKHDDDVAAMESEALELLEHPNIVHFKQAYWDPDTNQLI